MTHRLDKFGMKRYTVTYSDEPWRMAGGEKLEMLKTTINASSPAAVRRNPMFEGLKIHKIKLGKKN